MTRKWTPSSLPRLRLCLGPAALPHAGETTGDMRRGTELHAHLERVSSGMPVAESLAKVSVSWRADAAALDVDALPLRQGAAEVALALDLERGTARELGRGFTREQARAACRPGEMPMVLDWLGVTEDAVHVADWKTGAAEHLAPADSNEQLLTYMSAALLAYGKDEVNGALVRIDRDVPWWERARPRDALDVEAHLESLRGLLRAAAEAEDAAKDGVLPRLNVGPQCDWCPARRFCPAQVGQVLNLLNKTSGPAAVEVVDMTMREAGAAYQKVLGALSVLERMKKDLEGIAKSTPLPLPDGKVLRWEEREVFSVDIERAALLLNQRYGQVVVSAATKPPPPQSMTWESLGEALKVHALPSLREQHAQGRLPGRKPTAGGLLKATREMLEQAGAVRVSRYAAPKVVTPALPSGEVDDAAGADNVRGESEGT